MSWIWWISIFFVVAAGLYLLLAVYLWSKVPAFLKGKGSIWQKGKDDR